MEWMWNGRYQNSFDKAMLMLKGDAYMKFYNETKPLYLDASGIGM